MGFRAEEMDVSLGVGWTHAQGVYVGSWVVDAEAEGAKGVDFGIGVVDGLVDEFSDSFDPFFDDEVETA